MKQLIFLLIAVLLFGACTRKVEESATEVATLTEQVAELQQQVRDLQAVELATPQPAAPAPAMTQAEEIAFYEGKIAGQLGEDPRSSAPFDRAEKLAFLKGASEGLTEWNNRTCCDCGEDGGHIVFGGGSTPNNERRGEVDEEPEAAPVIYNFNNQTHDFSRVWNWNWIGSPSAPVDTTTPAAVVVDTPITRTQVREVGGLFTTDGSGMAFFGCRNNDSYFNSAGYGLGIGMRNDTEGATALLGVRADGVTSLKQFSFGQFTPMVAAGGNVFGGLSVRQNIVAVPTSGTKTVTATDPQGRETVVTTDARAEQPVAMTQVRTALINGTVNVSAGVGWDNQLFLMGQGGYEVTEFGNGWTVGGQFGGRNFRIGAQYNLGTERATLSLSSTIASKRKTR